MTPPFLHVTNIHYHLARSAVAVRKLRLSSESGLPLSASKCRSDLAAMQEEKACAAQTVESAELTVGFLV